MGTEDEAEPHTLYTEVLEHPAERHFDMQVHASQLKGRRLRKVRKTD